MQIELIYIIIFASIMGRVNTPQLNEAQKQALYLGFKNGTTHSFRMRCYSVLLKAEGRTSKEVGKLTDMCHITVNSWLRRYRAEGIEGLKTRPGRGRKPILKDENDKDAVLKIVKENRQHLQIAKAEWEMQSGKTVSRNTFRRFLKSMAENINA